MAIVDYMGYINLSTFLRPFDSRNKLCEIVIFEDIKNVHLLFGSCEKVYMQQNILDLIIPFESGFPSKPAIMLIVEACTRCSNFHKTL